MMIFPYLIAPWLPTNCDAPPTLYALMNSICNFDKEDKTNIYNLPKMARSTIFDFSYPLSTHVNKEDFEVMILKHFMMRRIGFETPTAFKIALDVKLNEIMPLYNKLFDALDGWDVFNSGETITRSVSENGTSALNTESTSGTTSDRRYSRMPQNEIDDVKDGNYMTDYNYDTTDATINSGSEGSTSNLLNETKTRSPIDKVGIYKKLLEETKNIYTMIFKDLDDLFYGIV